MIYKKSACENGSVSECIYTCNSCDHTEMVKGDLVLGKKCSKCGQDMIVISSGSSAVKES